MSLTHNDIIEKVESRFMQSLVSADYKAFKKMLHPDVVFTDETGHNYSGIDEIPYPDPDELRLTSCEVLSRSITLFTSVAVVNGIERVAGSFRKSEFQQNLRVTRNWKFNGRQWQLIAGGMVCLAREEHAHQ